MSHIVKRQKPESAVIYNDFDHYTTRIAHIPHTNRLLDRIRSITYRIPRRSILPASVKSDIISLIRDTEQEDGYVDYITLSSSLLWGGNYANDMDGMQRETWYNNVCKEPYVARQDYLDGLTVVHSDYRELLQEYKGKNDVVFIVDPPYMNTDTKSYSERWNVADHMDTLHVLAGMSYLYFSSGKSPVIDICKWIDENQLSGNLTAGSRRISIAEHVSYNSHYTDIMLYRPPYSGIG